MPVIVASIVFVCLKSYLLLLFVRCAVKMAAVFCHLLLLSLLLVLCLLVVDSVCCCCWLYKWFSKVYYVVCMSSGYLMSSLDSYHFVFSIMLCILLVCLVRVFAYVLHTHTNTHADYYIPPTLLLGIIKTIV